MLTPFVMIGMQIQLRFDFTAVSIMSWTCWTAPETPLMLALVSKSSAYSFLICWLGSFPSASQEEKMVLLICQPGLILEICV